jgi:hypothetical protein
MSYVELIDERTGFMAPMGGQTLGTELTERYNAAAPFPHVVIDDFLPAPLLEKVLEHCGKLKIDEEAATFDRPQERFKTSCQPDTLDDDLRALFYSFNSKPFIKLMENRSTIPREDRAGPSRFITTPPAGTARSGRTPPISRSALRRAMGATGSSS